MPMSEQWDSDVKTNSQSTAHKRTEKRCSIKNETLNIVRRVSSDFMDYDSRLLTGL